MNYKRLSKQYFEQYVSLSLYVKSLKEQRKKDNKNCTNLLDRRINLLYAICLDLKHTSEYLKKCERREQDVK